MSLKLSREAVILNPEIVALMQLIQAEGSITIAARKMGVSYNKAWRMLHQAESALHQPLVASNSGGASGGGSKLTPEGQNLMEKYLQLQNLVTAAADHYFQTIFKETAITGGVKK